MNIQVGDQFFHDFEVSQRVYNGFLNTFIDNNELHTDECYAQSKGFKSIVMHGNILNGFLSYFIGECLPLRNVIIHSQEIKFSKPVYLGDKLELTADITGVYESVKAIELRYKFKNELSMVVASGKMQIGLI